MAYGEELKSLDNISLGGLNKKTNKPNPTQIEGYYLRTEEHEDAKKKSGKGYTHFFLTQNGEESVWGKTDMDKKLRGARVGAMTLIVCTGKTKPTPNGDMILFSVRQDLNNVMDPAAQAAAEDPQDYPTDTDEDAPAETYTSAPKPPTTRAAAPNPGAVRDLLNKKRAG